MLHLPVVGAHASISCSPGCPSLCRSAPWPTSSACSAWTRTKACSGKTAAPCSWLSYEHGGRGIEGLNDLSMHAQQFKPSGMFRIRAPCHTLPQPRLPWRPCGLPAVAAHPGADPHLCQHHLRPSAASGAAGGGARGSRGGGRGEGETCMLLTMANPAALLGMPLGRTNVLKLSLKRWLLPYALHPAAGCLHTQACRSSSTGEPAAGGARAAHGAPQGAL